MSVQFGQFLVCPSSTLGAPMPSHLLNEKCGHVPPPYKAYNICIALQATYIPQLPRRCSCHKTADVQPIGHGLSLRQRTNL